MRGELGLEAFGHDGDALTAHVEDLVTEEDGLDGIGLAQRHAGGGFVDDNAEETFLVAGLDFIGEVLGEDFTAGVEDADEEFFFAGIADAGEVGAEEIAFAAEAVAGSAALGEDGLAASGISRQVESGAELVDGFLSSGGGWTGQEADGAGADLGLAMVHEEVELNGGEIAPAQCAGFHGSQQGFDAVGTAQEDGEGFIAEARGEGGPGSQQSLTHGGFGES